MAEWVGDLAAVEVHASGVAVWVEAALMQVRGASTSVMFWVLEVEHLCSAGELEGVYFVSDQQIIQQEFEI